MPLYDLLCLTKTALERPDVVKIMQKVGTRVISDGGILLRIKSYGNQYLAYDIRKPFERHSQAFIWEMEMMATHETLRHIDADLKLNTKVLRYMFSKKHKYKSPAERLLEKYASKQVNALDDQSVFAEGTFDLNSESPFSIPLDDQLLRTDDESEVQGGQVPSVVQPQHTK